MSVKKYTGAPFGSSSKRFQVMGLHPHSRPPGSFVQVAYDEESPERRLGPGTYETAVGGFDEKSVMERAAGPGWTEQLRSEAEASRPHLQYQEQWHAKRELVTGMAPGKYENTDFIQLLSRRPRSTRGICNTTGPRVEPVNRFHDSMPGPGSYGMGGIPQAVWEEKQKQAKSNVGLLSAVTPVTRALGEEKGCDLGPGQYEHKAFVEELLNKRVSAKGPYEVFSANRQQPIRVGYQAAPWSSGIAPGKYEHRTFVENLSDGMNKKKGRLSKSARFPENPTERIAVSTLSQVPRPKKSPTPCTYFAHQRSKSAPPNTLSGVTTKSDSILQRTGTAGEHVRQASAPFGSNTNRREDPVAKRCFWTSPNKTGVGRYDVNRFHDAQHSNGHCSLFQSLADRLPAVDDKRDVILRERLLPKNIPQRDRLFLVPS